MAATARIELAGVQIICRQAKTLIHLAGIQVIAQPLFPLPELPTFPTAPAGYWPERYDYPQAKFVDPTVRSPRIEGLPMFRTGYHPEIRVWKYILRHLTPEQKTILEDFQEQVDFGANPFRWTDVRPVNDEDGGYGSGGTYVVQFMEPLVFELEDDGQRYRCEVSLSEWAGRE